MASRTMTLGGSTQSTTYAYDKLGQLTRTNDPYDNSSGQTGTTTTYAYDRGGNILAKRVFPYTSPDKTPIGAVSTIRYAYADVNWKDKLTSINDKSITYDSIGNPTNDGTWAYTWQSGRQLRQMTKSGTTAAFTYNASGLRVRKTVNGTMTEYTLHGKQVLHLKQGNNNLHFFYDAQGKPAIVEFNGLKYGYVHNLQGDITSLVDNTGTTVVEYTYDAWGKLLRKSGTLATTLGTLNPFRYRGYVYDEETQLYYLRTRYYNPEWGRFINADSILGKVGGLLSHNLFAYCINDPVGRSDPDGLTSGSPFERDDSPWYYSDVTNPSQTQMILANNGLRKDGVTVSRKATSGNGELYVPVLNSTFMVSWSSIGTHHLDIRPIREGREAIVSYFGFTMDEPGTLEEWKKQHAWEPVEAYLMFNGEIVAGSVNLMLHSGSGSDVKLKVNSGNLCFYTYDSKTSRKVIQPLIQRHRDTAVRAYEFAMTMQYKEWIVAD